MIDIKFARDLAPLFPLQAVDAPKRKLVAAMGDTIDNWRSRQDRGAGVCVDQDS